MDDDFFKKYYGQLVGFTIKSVTFTEEDTGSWPSFVLQRGREQLLVTLSEDEEGNGPGFLFIGETK